MLVEAGLRNSDGHAERRLVSLPSSFVTELTTEAPLPNSREKNRDIGDGF